jgi:hypothetical protein
MLAMTKPKKETVSGIGAGGENEVKIQVNGFLTRDEMFRLKTATIRPASKHRKRTMKKWFCQSCRGSFFYQILRCPACGSVNVTQVILPTEFRPGGFF